MGAYSASPYKKQCSRPLSKRDESMTSLSYFVVPPTFGSAPWGAALSFPIFLRRDKTADVSVPAPALSFPQPKTAGRFQPGRNSPTALSVR